MYTKKVTFVLVAAKVFEVVLKLKKNLSFLFGFRSNYFFFEI